MWVTNLLNRCLDAPCVSVIEGHVRLVESRESNFREKYANIPPRQQQVLIDGDPSGAQKYLDWAGRVMTKEPETSPEYLVSLLKRFHEKVRGKDIMSFKTVADLEAAVAVKTRSEERSELENEVNVLWEGEGLAMGSDEDDEEVQRWRVCAPKTHRACQHAGGGTRWCIATSNSSHWDNYYKKDGQTIVIVTNLDTGRKYAIVGEMLDYAAIYDSQDHIIGNEEKNELFAALPEEAQEAIQDHFDSDEYARSNRQDEYRYEVLDEEWKSTGEIQVLKELVRLISIHTERPPSEKELREAMDSMTGSKDATRDVLKDLWDAGIRYHDDRGLDYGGRIEWPGLTEDWKDWDNLEFHEAAENFDFNRLVNMFDDTTAAEQFIEDRVRGYDQLARQFDMPEVLQDTFDKWGSRRSYQQYGSTYKAKFRITTLDELLYAMRDAGHGDVADAIEANRVRSWGESAGRRLDRVLSGTAGARVVMESENYDTEDAALLFIEEYLGRFDWVTNWKLQKDKSGRVQAWAAKSGTPVDVDAVVAQVDAWIERGGFAFR